MSAFLFAFAWPIAQRSVPALPLSAVLVTVKVESSVRPSSAIKSGRSRSGLRAATGLWIHRLFKAPMRNMIVLLRFMEKLDIENWTATTGPRTVLGEPVSNLCRESGGDDWRPKPALHGGERRLRHHERVIQHERLFANLETCALTARNPGCARAVRACEPGGAVCAATWSNRFLVGPHDLQVKKFLDPTRWRRVESSSPHSSFRACAGGKVSVVAFTRSPTGIRNNRRRKTLHESVKKRQKG